MARIELDVDERGWRRWANVIDIMSAVVTASVLVVVTVSDGPVSGLIATTILLVLLSPSLWLDRLARRAARTEAWIDVSPAGLTFHHPVLLSEDLLIGRPIIHSVVIGSILDEPRPDTADPVSTSRKRLQAWTRESNHRSRWNSLVLPSAAAPGLMPTSDERAWNYIVVLGEPYFLGRIPRRSVAFVSLMTKGFLCGRAPNRRYWIRGLFVVVVDAEAAIAALGEAGIDRILELTPEIAAWLENGRPTPLGRAIKNYFQDHRRREPGPLMAPPSRRLSP